jgi:hypothetical protein
MSHHGHSRMKGHHRPAASTGRRRWWHIILRKRSDEGDHVVQVGLPYPFAVFSYVSGHRDAPLSDRARLAWWLTGLAIVLGGIALIVLWARA